VGGVLAGIGVGYGLGSWGGGGPVPGTSNQPGVPDTSDQPVPSTPNIPVTSTGQVDCAALQQIMANLLTQETNWSNIEVNDRQQLSSLDQKISQLTQTIANLQAQQQKLNTAASIAMDAGNQGGLGTTLQMIANVIGAEITILQAQLASWQSEAQTLQQAITNAKNQTISLAQQWSQLNNIYNDQCA
jgi:DNA repair exonuclease SbcCD ATPase subunit